MPKQNIIKRGGHVNVEGQNATLSKDGKSVTYPYTVAFQRMHTSWSWSNSKWCSNSCS